MKRVLLALLPLLLIPVASAQQRGDDPLAPLTRCFDGSEFKVGSRDRQFFSLEQRDIEHLTVRKTAMDGHGIANMETLIQRRTSTVATAYLIDTNSAGFEALRGEFLSLLSACVEKQ